MTSLEERFPEVLFDSPSNGHDSLLERLMERQRASARTLRSVGMGLEAVKAERAATRIRLALDAPKETERMFARIRAVRATAGRGALLARALEGAISLLGADLGNIQLRAGGTRELRIVAHAGFDTEFLEHFAVVSDDSSACGRAARGRAPIVIADVRDDESFKPHRRIAAASRFRGVLSVPLVDGADGLLGVMSVHFHEAHEPSSRDLLLIDWYAQEIGQALAARPVSRAINGRALSESAKAAGAGGRRGSELRHARR